MKLAKRYFTFLLACVLFPLCVNAQTPTLKVIVPNVVSVGERFQIVFEANVAGIDNYTAPSEWNNLNILAGPHSSTKWSSSYINGKSSSSAYVQIIYVAVAQKEGKITIDGVSVEIGGKTYAFASKEIEVVKEDSGRSSSGGGAQPTSSGSSQTTAASGDDLFVRVNVSKSSLYKGDCFIATVKIYVRNTNLRGFEDFKFPTFNGFYSQELEAPTQLVFQRENVNGRIYETAVIRKYILYPQHTGALKIEPFETVVVTVIPSSRPRGLFDDMFAPQGEIARKRLTSPQVTINVKDLPAGAPVSFSGAVGDFTIETSLSKPEVTANNAVTYTTKITGTGNFKLFTAPKPSFPADFEVYEPKTNDNLKNSASGLTGSRSSEVTIIPRSAGSYTIPPTEFVYFNPGKGEYVTLRSKEHTLTVARDSTSSQSVAMPSNKQQDIRYIGEDIRSNKLVPQSWRMVGSTFFGSLTFYSIFIFAIILFVVAIFIFREMAKRRGNVVQMRNRKANAVAKKRLSVAGKLLKSGDIACFYEELLKASWGYLGDKFNIPVSNLSRDNVREVLNNKNVDAEDIDAFITVVDECEFARYAPGTGHTEMEKVYGDAINVISKLEQKIR